MFYPIDLSQGDRVFVLAFDQEEAELAALKFWGWVNYPVSFVNDGQEYPTGPFGPMGYLDAMIMLEGDTVGNPPFRASNGTPFRSLGHQFLDMVKGN